MGTTNLAVPHLRDLPRRNARCAEHTSLHLLATLSSVSRLTLPAEHQRERDAARVDAVQGRRRPSSPERTELPTPSLAQCATRSSPGGERAPSDGATALSHWGSRAGAKLDYRLRVRLSRKWPAVRPVLDDL